MGAGGKKQQQQQRMERGGAWRARVRLDRPGVREAGSGVTAYVVTDAVTLMNVLCAFANRRMH